MGLVGMLPRLQRRVRLVPIASPHRHLVQERRGPTFRDRLDSYLVVGNEAHGLLPLRHQFLLLDSAPEAVRQQLPDTVDTIPQLLRDVLVGAFRPVQLGDVAQPDVGMDSNFGGLLKKKEES